MTTSLNASSECHFSIFGDVNNCSLLSQEVYDGGKCFQFDLAQRQHSSILPELSGWKFYFRLDYPNALPPVESPFTVHENLKVFLSLHGG